jgi:hypothetical protein
MFEGIQRSNYLLENIDQVPDLPEERRDRYVAEARFLRAFIYFELIKRFGGVPIVDRTYDLRDADGSGDELRPAVGDDLELAVAVELVAEQVGEEEQPGLELLRDAREPSLVDLEQAELAPLASGVEQRRGHPPGHVRSGAVVHHGTPVALEAGRDHGRGGGLPVGGREQHGAGLELGGHSPHRPGGDPEQHPAGRGGAAGAAAAAAGAPHEAG